MTIEPISNRTREISVTEAIEPAFERVKIMLFRPFDLGKWIVVGFCAWLAGLGESGGGGFNLGNHGFDHHGNGQPAEELRRWYHDCSEYILANLDWIIPVSVCLFVLVVILGLAILWVNSHGKFMFLHCVAYDKAEVAEPWSKYSQAANSLFWFRLVLCLAGLVLTLPLVIFIAVNIVRMILHGEPDVAGILLSVGLGLVVVGISLVFFLIRKLTMDFVVPIMFLRGTTSLAAWREFSGLLGANPGNFALYILFQVVLHIAIGALVMAVFIATCCIACCLSILPFVGTVLLLPVLVFKRAYSLYYLAQYGPTYDVFPAAPAPTPTPAFPAPPTAH